MKIFNHPNIIEGQSTPMRRERLDPRNFPPARNIPLHPMPRINSASSVTEDMPLSPNEHRLISDIAQYESKFSVAQQKVNEIMQGKDPFLKMTIDRRLRSYFELNKALAPTSSPIAPTGGKIIEGVLQQTEQAVTRSERAKRLKENEKRKLKSQNKKEKNAVRASSGYESPSETTERAIKEWSASDEKGASVERKSAKAFLKKKGVESGNDDELALAIRSGYQPKDASLNNYIEGGLESATKRNEELVEIATVNRAEIDGRLKSDFKKEIDHAFSVMPAEMLTKDQYKDMDANSPKDRESIVLAEGYKPESANPSTIPKDVSAERLLSMATKQGLFDGKVGRKHQYASKANADNWRETTFSAYDEKDSIGNSSRKAPQENQEGGEAEPNVIATGKRGGKITGYRTNGSPIYLKGSGGTKAPPSSEAPPIPQQSQPSSDGYQAVKRTTPMDTTKLNKPSSLAKSLEVASKFTSLVLKRKVENGQICKGADEILVDKLDEAYERLVHVRPLLNRHHSSQHNEIVHLLRDAHANPTKGRVDHAIELADHFIESVCKESKIKSERAEEAIYTKPKKTKKAIVKLGRDGLIKSDLRAKRMQEVKGLIKRHEDLVFEHNMDVQEARHLDSSVVKACFVRSSSIQEAIGRLYTLTDLAKGEDVSDEDIDLLGDSNPSKDKTDKRDVDSLLKSPLSDEDVLEAILKGIVSDDEGEDQEVDDDEFERDQEQLEEEVSYGVNPDREDDEEPMDKAQTMSEFFQALKDRSGL